MSFDKKLKKAVNEIEIPEELLPCNIEAMLRARAAANAPAAEEIPAAKAAPVIVPVKKSNRTVIMRTIAAAAACVALAGGFMAFNEERKRPSPIESEIDYEAVKVQTYDELYNIYTEIYLKNSGEQQAQGAENGDGVEIITDETAITEVTTSVPPISTQPPVTQAAPAVNKDTEQQENIEAVRSDFSDADIVKSDDSSIYYICGGTLYAVDKNDMSVIAEIESAHVPFEMYVKSGSLVLISEENTSDSSTDGSERNVIAEIYDISSGKPVLRDTYKQNGSYTSARLDDNGVLCIVTGYSDYRTDPLDENPEPESYVPAYYIGGEKKFVAPENVYIPQGANNTDYTVVSSVNCADPASASVKAVLGSSSNAYSSESSLYVAGTGVKDGKAYTAVTAFTANAGNLEWRASTVLDGELISRYSMAEDNGYFRIACRGTDENGMTVTNIYTLDSSLNIYSMKGSLLPGKIIGTVKLDGGYASLIEKGSTEPTLVISLDKENVPAAETSAADENTVSSNILAAYVAPFGENNMIGIGSVKNDADKNSQLVLEMYGSQTGEKTGEIVFADIADVTSPALTDKKALLADFDNNIIGVPVSGRTEFGTVNRYYVFSYTQESGFTEKGVIEYTDVAESYQFERAVINDGKLVIIGSGRIVTVSLADMTVIDKFDLK